MDRLLRLPSPPDAVFCYNDLLAIGAMRAILSRGLRIPQDVAVVGFDDIEDARYAFPSLTTISPDKESIARLAVARLFDRMKGDEAPPASRSVDYRLVVRESTIVG
jgi:LacI family transcriptional regulator, repressor for deo operon, udp, cdd, tsx, nupC, and nupG